MSLELCGWVDDQAEVEQVWSQMPTPFFAAPAPENRDQHNHTIFKNMIGTYHPEGPQEIGDCVSWGNGNLINYTQVLEAWMQIQELRVSGATDEQVNKALEEARYEYQETATEVIYALSRVEIGGGRIRGDGSVGAWAAKALTDYGTISRKELDKLGVGGRYSGSRARSWGRSGLPDELEPAARQHLIADMTPVRSFNDLAWHIQNLRVVAVCSNVGFENGRRGVTQRDEQGFATARGSWAHCMLFVSVKMGGRPGALLCNQWPKGTVQGPMGDVEIPDCSWWVDADTVDRMLRQNDSFTGTKYKGYPARRLNWRF